MLLQPRNKMNWNIKNMKRLTKFIVPCSKFKLNFFSSFWGHFAWRQKLLSEIPWLDLLIYLHNNSLYLHNQTWSKRLLWKLNSVCFFVFGQVISIALGQWNLISAKFIEGMIFIIQQFYFVDQIIELFW
jgi:hypothetical protein